MSHDPKTDTIPATLSEAEARDVAHKIAHEICDLFDPGDDGEEVFDRVVRIVLPAVRSVPPPPLPPLASPIYGLLTRRFRLETMKAAEIGSAVERLVDRLRNGKALADVPVTEEIH